MFILSYKLVFLKYIFAFLRMMKGKKGLFAYVKEYLLGPTIAQLLHTCLL